MSSAHCFPLRPRTHLWSGGVPANVSVPVTVVASMYIRYFLRLKQFGMKQTWWTFLIYTMPLSSYLQRVHFRIDWKWSLSNLYTWPKNLFSVWIFVISKYWRMGSSLYYEVDWERDKGRIVNLRVFPKCLSCVWILPKGGYLIEKLNCFRPHCKVSLRSMLFFCQEHSYLLICKN